MLFQKNKIFEIPDFRTASNPVRQGFDTLQGVAVVELKQNVVGSELGFVGTADVVMAEVLVHVLQRLDAFRQVLVVQLPIKLTRFLKINKKRFILC